MRPSDMMPAHALEDFANNDPKVDAILDLIRRRARAGEVTRKGARKAIGLAVDVAAKRYAALRRENPASFEVDPRRFDKMTRNYVADELLAQIEAQQGAIPAARKRPAKKRSAARFVAIGGHVFKV